MAKTFNKDIDIFGSEKAARAAFTKSTVPCQLLLSTSYGYTWFIDRSKTAIKEWPKHYTLLDEK